MEPKSTFSILPNTILYWENNYATFGGAIYVHNVRPLSYCHIYGTLAPKKNALFNSLARICLMVLMSNYFFRNSFAEIARSVLYGGAI